MIFQIEFVLENYEFVGLKVGGQDTEIRAVQVNFGADLVVFEHDIINVDDKPGVVISGVIAHVLLSDFYR